MRKIILVLMIFVIYDISYCVDSPLNDSYYLGEVPDSAAIGRGGAYVGVAGSPFSPYWNPAGIVSLKKNTIGFSLNLFGKSDIDSSILKKTYPLEGRKLNFISVCGPQVAMYWRPLSEKVDISTGTINGQAYERTIDVKSSVYGLTVAVPHAEKVDFGMNINLITGMLGYLYKDAQDTELILSDGLGWGLDWGLIYKLTPDMNIGVSVTNLPAQIYWEDFDKEVLPTVFRAGFDLQLNQLMSFAMDYENAEYDDSVDDNDMIHVGMEHYIRSNFLVRAGMYARDFNDSKNAVYTAGLGYSSDLYQVDIAVRQYYIDENDSELLQRVSASAGLMF
ncbi:hypothetical protein ACFLTD_02385 [Elusimicrobiota bacterium]